MAAALAHLAGHVVLGPAELLDQFLIGRRLLDHIEVGALDILDDGDFQRLVVRQFAHHHRHVVQLGHLRGAPAALARHDLIGIGTDGPDQDGREHALFLDGCRQVRQRLFVETLARLILAGPQESDRQGTRVLCARGLALHRGDFIADERGQATAKASRPVGGRRRVHAAVRMRSRWISSPASLI